MARKTKEEALETRERILAVSVDVFYEKGVSASTLEEIAEAAGVTRGAVYWHFKNKLDLFSAMHDQMHTSIMAGFQIKAEENTPPLIQLQDFCVNFLLGIANDERKKRIYSLFTIKCDYSGELSSFLTDLKKKKKESLDLTTSFFVDAQQKGQISPQNDPAFLSLSFFCYVGGIFSEYLRHPEFFDLEKQVRPMIEQFFKSIK